MLPPDAPATWTEASIRAFFRSGGAERPAEDNGQPGGGRDVPTLTGPKEMADDETWARANSAAEYQRVAQEKGIPYRANGLFPPNDAVLKECMERCAKAAGFPFQKLVISPISGDLEVALVSWGVGDKAAQSGLDLRYFFDPSNSRVFGAVRFSEDACIAKGGGLGAHGGAVQTALDELMGEVAKIAIKPMVLTSDAQFKLKKPAPPLESLRVEAWLKEDPGDGPIIKTLAEMRSSSGEVIATATATQCDLAKLKALYA